MLVFENPGLIDMTAATTLGVNVKDGTTPIGQFGTGLKIAIAVVLRLGGSIEIWRGKKLHTFAIRKKTIRGKEFGLVTMNGRDLGFTDAYGAHWEPWMAYRELWSNARDEGGQVRRMENMSGDTSMIGPKKTLIVVTCPELERAHEERHKIVLQTEPLVVMPGLEIHAGDSEHIFYRGIRVWKLPKKSRYTYNLTGQHQLTEDRTLAYQWMVGPSVARALVQCTSMMVLADVLGSPDDHKTDNSWEATLPFGEIKDQKPSPQFMEIAEQLSLLKKLSPNARNLHDSYRDSLPGYRSPYLVEISSVESEVLDRALGLLARRVSGEWLPSRAEIRFKSKMEGYVKVHVSRRDGLTLEHSVLARGHEETAMLILEGLAQMNGSAVHQLASLVVRGHFEPEKDSDRAARPVGSTEPVPVRF